MVVLKTYNSLQLLRPVHTSLKSFVSRQQSQLARINLVPLATTTTTPHSHSHPLSYSSFHSVHRRLATFSVSSHPSLSLHHTRPFVTSTTNTEAQAAYAMDDFEDSFLVEDESDAFSPEKPVKKPAAKKATTAKSATTTKKTEKKAAAPRSDKPKAPAKPRAKKPKVVEELDEGLSFEMDQTFDVLETPQSSSGGPSPPRPTVLQETNAAGSKKNASETYQKLTQLEHVLVRPDTYIGSTEAQSQQMWVYDSEKEMMVFKDVKIVPGLYKIFDEILVNAADNKIRDPTMDNIRVNVDRENGSISIYNNGRGIPIEIHEKEKIYIPELIFGHLLTSSNYDDSEKKVVGGRNGYGAKLCNIFSTEFTIDTADKNTQQKYVQTWTNNMSKVGKAKITSNKAGKEYTHITFKPDLKRFGMESLDADFEAVVKRRVYDMAGCVKGVKVDLNGERIKIKSFKQYVEMYVSSNAKKEVEEGMEALEGVPKPSIVHQIVNDRWEVAFTLSDGQFNQVSFVNSIATTKGGTHVDHVAQQIITKLVEEVKKKNKAAAVKAHQIKQHLWIFVNCLVENPAFDSQTKENMTLRSSAFGSKCNLSDDFIKKVLKSGVVDSVLTFAKFKAEQQLAKTGGSKRARLTGFMKLDDANKAGTKDGSRCTLILTEGDSAKALTTAGLGIVGRDLYGVFPLRGKLLNVREATHEVIMKNAEITAIRQIMGLQHGKKYEDTKSLRYGHLMIMTDQDHDGSHIKGLIINYFETFFPSLLAIPGFLIEFITPIVRVTKGPTNDISFFTMPEYEYWKETTPDHKKWTMKYYKGLGTSTAVDAKIYFNDLDKHLKQFHAMQEGDKELIELAFSKKKADERKEWLRTYRPGLYLDHTVDQIPIADFINKELILYSMADNIRSIPSMVDGLKPGQRKVMFGSFKRNLVKEIKVAQLGGYIGEHTAYHHGEQSMYSTIIGLAQTFVGSNNINLMAPNGQFGTRAQGGPDAASPRYIFTQLTAIARKVFRPNDDALLNYLDEDGKKIEPEWYMPVIPMILVNGADGIGTGWSSKIPNYNPQDIIDNLRRLLRGEEVQPMMPWYRGFTGPIETTDKPGRYKVSGIIKLLDDNVVEITELPVSMWTQEMKEFLEKEVMGTEKGGPGMVKDYEEHHLEHTVHFKVQMREDKLAAALEEGLENKFKMVNYINTTNMVAFDPTGRIRKYESPEDILTEFYHLRLEYYQKRKDYMAQDLTLQLDKLTNQVKFVQMIIKKELVVSGRKKLDIIRDLKTKGFKAFPKVAKPVVEEDNAEAADEEAEVEDTSDNGYDYLLTMAIYSLTTERVNTLLKQRGAKEVELNELLNLSAKDLWNRDLDDLSVAFQDMLNQDILNAQQDQKGKKKTTSKFAKVNRKRVSDAADGGEYMEKKPKAAKLKANTSPNSKPSKTTSFAAKPSGAKEMHTAAFTSVNKTGASSLAIPKKETLTKATSIITIDDDDEFDALIKDVRPSKPSTVDLVSPSTAVKPKKTFSIPGIKKPSTSAPKPRAVSKSKAPKRKVESDDEDDSFAFMDEGPSAPAVEARRPARAAASKARAIVLTSDDVFDELDDEEELDSEEEDDE